jgi:hypothetical protein
MAGPACSVYARRSLTEDILVEIELRLSDGADEVNGTRKGRIWDVWVANRPFHVAVRKTADVLSQCEDELLELGLLPDEVPFLIELSAGANEPEDYTFLARVSEELARIVDGIATVPVK